MKPPKQRDVLLIILAAAAATTMGGLYLFINLYYADGFLTFPLDDAYIFLQYARNFAAGHPFVYNVGDPPTTGATSYLYLFVITGLAFLFRGPNALVWATFVLNVAFYAASIYLFAKTAGRLFAGRFVLPATLIYITFGPTTFHAFAGMDTGLFVLALLAALYTYLLFSEYGRTWPFVFALGALTLARPEGIIAAAIFVALALVARAPAETGTPRPRRRSKWLVLLGLAPVPAYFLLNYIAGGHITSASFISKSIWGAGVKPWPMRLAEVLSFSFYAIKNVLAGLEGSYARNLYNGNIPLAAASYFAPLTLAFFLVGWGRAARKSWANRRPSPAFAAGIIFIAGVAASCSMLPYPRHFSRYLVPYYPLFLFGILVGIDGLAVLIRYGRPTISHAAMFWTGAAYFLTFGVLSSTYFWLTYGMAARDIRFQHIAVARYIRESVPPASNIFTHDVGALAYYSGHRIVDLEGLVTRESISYSGKGPGWAANLVRKAGKVGDFFAGYLFIYPFDEVGAIGTSVYQAKLFTTTLAGNDKMVVAPFMPLVFEAPRRPQIEALPDFTLADEVSVAEGVSASGHAYRLKRRGGNNLPTFAAALPFDSPGGQRMIESGLVACGVEEFTVKVPPGREIIVAVRCEPPYRADVHVNGVSLGRWEIAAGQTDTFTDGYFRIPARVVSDGQLRVRLRSVGDDLSPNRPVRYYFYVKNE